MTTKFMAGVAFSPFKMTSQDQQRLRDAGLQWLRCGIHGLDEGCFFRGEKQPEEFYQCLKTLAETRRNGFQIMGLTPSPKGLSSEAGEPGSPGYFENYRRLCRLLGEECKGLIDYWQIANEVDIWIFRDKLTIEQSAEFLKAGLRGMREAGPDLKLGVNITLFPSKPGEVDGNTDKHEGVFIAKSIYQDPSVDTDYVGFDSYPGTWREGGAESWHEYLDSFYELTKKPIIIQEFGYSSAGDLMTEAESRAGAYPCEVKKWKFSWRGAHTPQIQADFITESYKIFAEKPYVIGATYFSWKDAQTCWQCGQPDCPAETAWGLLDRAGNLKPSYHALKASLETYFKGRLA